ncbi:DUF1707 SHOCT-like domain-containing protein [Streptomyces purpureus]|nr:DUF1707 domain-containing protein [Streptomyces purpureus]
MRASDAERERIAERLRDAVAEGRLDMEEFEERLDAAYKARTQGELEPLVRDLPAPASSHAAAPAEQAGWASRIGKQPTSKGAFSFWGGFYRRGTWTVPRSFTAVTFQGGGDLDLREANFEDREIVIRCVTIMGGMRIVVPPELTVDVTGFGLMGGFDDRATGDGTPGSPRVRITGFALMGGVGVERKRRKADKAGKRELEG